MSHDDYRDVPLTLAVTLTLWAGTVAASSGAGIFVRVPQEAYLALAAFATVFASCAVLVDARVRGWLAARGATVAWTTAAGLALLLVAGGVALAREGEVALASAAWPLIVLVAVPFTAASAIATIRAAFRPGAARARIPVPVSCD